ncbi:uncharacterized protein BXZ73DRAFT_79835 [Epithele typhae]|uniref:uncharacterized protein n=1 Tax=Epithele typhae TaxID=378194 RepID=UPI0020074029|nr:uncharacterized protein BXZ73DRAFT_79835 [Epithele typhae]KAH9921690.1 hypothetical protein BXZ73DRAFT_79835 [Epithele typhae]
MPTAAYKWLPKPAVLGPRRLNTRLTTLPAPHDSGEFHTHGGSQPLTWRDSCLPSLRAPSMARVSEGPGLPSPESEVTASTYTGAITGTTYYQATQVSLATSTRKSGPLRRGTPHPGALIANEVDAPEGYWLDSFDAPVVALEDLTAITTAPLRPALALPAPTTPFASVRARPAKAPKGPRLQRSRSSSGSSATSVFWTPDSSPLCSPVATTPTSLADGRAVACPTTCPAPGAIHLPRAAPSRRSPCATSNVRRSTPGYEVVAGPIAVRVPIEFAAPHPRRLPPAWLFD